MDFWGTSSACQKTEYSVKKLNSVVRHAVDSSSILLLLSVPLDINNRTLSQGAKSSPPMLPLGLHALEYDKSALFNPLISLQAWQSTLQVGIMKLNELTFKLSLNHHAFFFAS